MTCTANWRPRPASEKASRLRLNAEGYQVALETLQQQFPYFIRTWPTSRLRARRVSRASWTPVASPRQVGSLRQRLGATDQGYMRPGGTRAHTVQSGFYRLTARSRLWHDGHEAGRRRSAVRRGEGGQGEGSSNGARQVRVVQGGAARHPAPTAPGLNGPTGGPAGGCCSRSAATPGCGLQASGTRPLSELIKASSAPLAAQRFVNLQSTPAARRTSRPCVAWTTRRSRSWFAPSGRPEGCPDRPGQGSAGSPLPCRDRNAMKAAFKGADRQAQDRTSSLEALPATSSVLQTAEDAADYVADLALKIVDTDLVDPAVRQRSW